MLWLSRDSLFQSTLLPFLLPPCPSGPLISWSHSEPPKSKDDFCSGHRLLSLTTVIAHLGSGVTYSNRSSSPSH